MIAEDPHKQLLNLSLDHRAANKKILYRNEMTEWKNERLLHGERVISQRLHIAIEAVEDKNIFLKAEKSGVSDFSICMI